MVKINGEVAENVVGKDLKTCLTEAGFEIMKVVVERNLTIVPRAELANVLVEDGDSIEVLRFVGGG